MSKHDLQARSIHRHQRDSIEAHRTIVFAALAVSRWIEDRTGWSIKKVVRTARRYRIIHVSDALLLVVGRRHRSNRTVQVAAISLR
jgi:hypothetical protein